MTPEEKALLGWFRRLPQAERRSLLDFAEFLAARGAPAAAPDVPGEPLAIPRPAEETVVRAIRRLRSTYPMLDPRKLLHETSHWMTQHAVHGRPAAEVIDELEGVFARHYDKLKGGD